MQIITLHNTYTEEIIGSVYPIGKINFDDFINLIRKSFKEFHRHSEAYNDDDYSIEDFVDFHNEIYKLKIDYVVSDFIQLSENEI